MKIDLHPSASKGTLERDAVTSLQANRVDPKFLYATPRQSDLWRQVFLRHSPIHANLDFARIYRDAFARAVDLLPAGKVMLVGLGCGTGMKEAELCSQLKSNGREVLFSAIDVSRELVEESAQKLVAAGAEHERSLVCDLAEADYLAEWLARDSGELPRLFTFFGLVPNFEPSLVIRLFRALLRPGDALLVSAHLAPVGGDRNLSAAMRSVLPQYDNPETLAWLTGALEHGGLQKLVDRPEMKIGEIEGIPAFIATARWKTNETFERWGHRFSPKIDGPLRLFHSLRYTPALFEDLLRGAGFNLQRLATTACLEEAIWAVRQG